MIDRKFVCVLGEDSSHHATVTVYADVPSAGKVWMEQIGSLKSSGYEASVRATDDRDDAADGSAAWHHQDEDDVYESRQRLIDEGEVHCVSPEDSEIHLIRTEYMLEEEKARSGRLFPEEDEGHVLFRTATIKTALRKLYRAGQLGMDFWVCRKCGTPNHPSGTICRVALSIDRPRW
eukprot:6418947-Pyramimonas_sp.AAC.1